MHTRYLDIHVLEHRPPSCLNRDRHNMPKTMTVGNATRIMVPAQAQRRPQRLALESTLEEPAARTRNLPPQVARALRAAGWPEELARFAAGQIARSATAKGLETNPKEDHRTNAMLLVAADSIVEDLAELCTAHRADLEKGLARLQKKKEEPDDSDDTNPGRGKPPALLPTDQVAACLNRPTATIHLFGRMLAGLTDADVPSAVQTAPALTTHRSDLQPDFVTAVDDWQDPGDRGSAFMDTTFLTSGVFYRFTTVNLTDLTRKLDSDQNQALRLAGLFMRAVIMTVLPAKQTSTAPHTVPDLVAYAVRDGRPVTYASAFEQPVQATPKGGYLTPSYHALDTCAGITHRLTGTGDLVGHGYATAQNNDAAHLGTRHDSFDTLIAAALAHAATDATGQPPANAA
ncbi:type I-E CRISPR-associated protein Cas7/Cse4/CasC [Streptomyces sp. NPDC051920]|uniref:type I-E CRISPR-associated protein Cas7/Cse4/CasC n=1 Tax=Streptomyces sp. NPDC051920 TaxID=3155523 RepID=UPI003440C6C2